MVVCFTLITCMIPVQASSFEELTSQYVYVIDDDTKQVLYDKNASARMYPASLTKMMTCIIALESNRDEELVTITSEMLQGLIEENAYVVGLKVGDTLPMIDLIYGSAVASGADATNAIALTICPTIDEFVALMNEKAVQLGMVDTHFTNPIGLHNDNHYSTAKDMATLLSYGLQNEEFKQIFSASSYTTSPIVSHPDGLTIHSSSKSVIQKEKLDLPEYIGGKTGYTIPAGHCLASWIEVNEMNIISITGLANTPITDSSHIHDLNTIIQQLRTYHKDHILSQNEVIGSIKIHNLFTTETKDILCPNDITFDTDETNTITTQLDIQNEINRQNVEQTIEGSLNLLINDTVVQTIPISVTVLEDSNPITRAIRSIYQSFRKKAA